VYWCLLSPADSLQKLLMAKTAEEHPLGWTEDGLSLYWQSGDDVYLWNIDRDEKTPVLTLPAGIRWIRYDLASGADCEPRRGIEDAEFICAVDESYTDLYLIENFDPHVN